MAYYVESGAAFEATFDTGVSGLVGTIEVEINDGDGNTVTGPTALDITEEGTSGVYTWNAPSAPGPLGQYSIIWSNDGSFTPEGGIGLDELNVVDADVLPVDPIGPPAGGGVQMGPGTVWVTGEDVAACCSVETSDGSVFDTVAISASQLLFELSGRLFPGPLGPKKVRPDCTGCTCGYQVTSGGYVIEGMWSSLCCFCGVQCEPSIIKLAGYPVRNITEVKIDGVAINPSGNYRLHKHRYAMRTDGLRWPVRQDLTLQDSEEHTFSISYTYGQSPPQLGVDAAAQLACEMYKACSGVACALPTGTIREVRQNLTIEKSAFISWGYNRGWKTGLSLVDAFLAAYNPTGMRRQPTFWAPGKRQYAQTWQG